MKTLKILSAFVLVIITFSSCQKCMECHWDDDEWHANGEDFGDQMFEICSDDFESRKDFDDYIKEVFFDQV